MKLKLETVTKLLGVSKHYILKHSPEILAGLGVGTMIEAVVEAVRATPPALEAIEKGKEQAQENGKNYTALNTVADAGKYYIPTGLLMATSTACIIGGNRVSAKRLTAAAAAYQLSEAALVEYKDAVKEVVGEKKSKVIEQKATENHVENNPPSQGNIYISGKGDYLCMDYESGRYFRCDIDKVKLIEAELDNELARACDNFLSVNRFYEKVGLPCLPTTKGWNLSAPRDHVKFNYIYTGSPSGEPCLVIKFEDLGEPLY